MTGSGNEASSSRRVSATECDEAVLYVGRTREETIATEENEITDFRNQISSLIYIYHSQTVNLLFYSVEPQVTDKTLRSRTFVHLL